MGNTARNPGAKMAKEYSRYDHTHVTVNHPTAKRGEGWDGAHGIILHTGTRVWVHASYAHERTPEIKQVGDGENTGFDQDGNCILSVPASWCSYYTVEEAEQIERLIDADEELLSYI
jgi:hypothetical protein